jgi:hypothetical protein
MRGKMGLIDFGKALIETGDIDPVYTMLWEGMNCGLFGDTHTMYHRRGLASCTLPLQKWLLAYWCFYHVGTASLIASINEGVDRSDTVCYWTAMNNAAQSKEYPRCPERRHFRGQNAIDSVTHLQRAGLTKLFTGLIPPWSVEPGVKPSTLGSVMEEVRTWVGFGPWIAFKVADMLERLALRRISFLNADTFLFDSPREGAELAHMTYRSKQLPRSPKKRWRVYRWAVGYIVNGLKDYNAPPRGERDIGPQEAETILCKWSSHMKGHYEVGEDILAVRRGLLRFPRVRLCQDLLKAGKRGDLWE